MSISGASGVFRFGEFHFDSHRRLLFKGTVVTPVSDRLAMILTQLLLANGRTVTKDALASSIWPNEAVSDANLTQHIYMLRRLLGETAKDRSYIRAVPRYGYRMSVPVQRAEGGYDEVFSRMAASLSEVVAGSDVEAFRNYCQGSFLLAQRTAPALRRALGFFQAALDVNPQYIPALVGLARSYGLLGAYWYMPSRLTCPLAEEALTKALALDPQSAVVRAVYSGYLLFCKWDLRGARREIELAIQLNPGSSLVRNNAAWQDVCAGRYDAALDQAHLALTLEPSALVHHVLMARVFLHSGQYDQAVAIMSNVLEMDPTFAIARRYRAQAQLLAGRPSEAMGDLRLLLAESEEDITFRLPMLARAHADFRERDKALEIFAQLLGLSETQYVVFWNLAIVATGLQRFEEALNYLEAAYQRREPALLFLKSLPWFEPISRDARFQRLLADVYDVSS